MLVCCFGCVFFVITISFLFFFPPVRAETAMQYNYSYGDGGIVDKTSAEFKALGDNIKAKKKESVGTCCIPLILTSYMNLSLSLV